MTIPEGMKKKLSWLASTECAVVLFLAIAALAIPGTFTESRTIYSSPPFLLLLGCFGLNLALCTIKRLKTLSKPVLVMHGGVLLTLAGCIATSFGFVATVNVYEGDMVDQVYRWDREQDVPLGAELVVKKVNREFYPIPVKVGVLRGEAKEGLFVLKTGESFDLKNYRVKVESLEFPAETLKLSVFDQGRLIGNCDTSGASTLPPGFPYAFKLVAYQNPSLKRLWVDLELARGSEKLVEGTSEVNSPFQWNGLYFYNTRVDRDAAGAVYAGIQIVRDPGRPYVFAGFAIMGLGAVLSFIRRFYGKVLWR
ncbi:ResB-like family cytochrome C biogenesis protein [Geobacter luticola]|uniref:ResB-like family cytochrome C biogenesis protein n=2 Tax=Geomobilimonas luticola TaxID=1114878 RepID=A0ABS5SAB4_9BACT|nr:ResB-like family cytochrome C biogenesis protein [Geomobilimonas luticola]